MSLNRVPSRRKLDLILRGRRLRLGTRTAVMAVINVTPDSFYPQSRSEDPDDAVGRALQCEQEGADLVDLGAESTRPGAEPLSADDEWRRLAPVLTKLRPRTPLPLSIDTRTLEVARRGLEEGADLINDISGTGGSGEIASLVAEYSAGLVIMHMQGGPLDMQRAPHYDDVITEIAASLSKAVARAEVAGVTTDAILVDPGIGFGKTLSHNLLILNRLYEFTRLEKPILVGTSRKSFIGHLMDLPVEQRLHPTSASVAMAIARGAHMVRVHDVKEMKQVATLADAICNEAAPRGLP